MKRNPYYIATPAYNEARNIGPYIRTLIRAVQEASARHELINTYICANGCSDNTEAMIQDYIIRYPSLKIKFLTSEKGMNRAIGKIMEELPHDDVPVVKIDADVRIKRMALVILLDELQKHPEIQVAGAHPRARNYKGKYIYKQILTNILDVRSRYPQSQIAVYDVSKFHQVALIDPQPRVPANFELRSRIYFHGRMYAMRNRLLWRVPPNRIGDDTYLTLDIYKRFGSNSIRLRYDAIVTYHATTSLRFHWRVYKRIFCDTYTLFDLPEFKKPKMQEIIKLEAVKLDWEYIKKLPLTIQLCFRAYEQVKRAFHYWFERSPQYCDTLWTYKVKTN